MRVITFVSVLKAGVTIWERGLTPEDHNLNLNEDEWWERFESWARDTGLGFNKPGRTE